MEPEENRPKESGQAEKEDAEKRPVEFKRKQRVAPRRGPGLTTILLLAMLGMMIFLLTR